MCKYCSELFTGNCNDSLVSKDISLLGSVIMEVDVFIDNDTLKLYIDNSNGDCIAKKVKKIKYCPMCGRKLSRD